MALPPSNFVPPALTADDIEKLTEKLSKQQPKFLYYLHPHEVKRLKELDLFNPETMKEIKRE